MSGTHAGHKQVATSGVRFDPVKRQMQGWTIYVEPALLEGEHAEVGRKSLDMLENHLERIAVLVPEDRLAELRKMEIWIEVDHPEMNVEPGPYHPGEGWLIERGYDARLAKKVHITRAASLLERHHMVKHPMVVLHELAHAYHDQVLGFDDPRIIEAYENAMEKGLYDQVLDYKGRQVPAYATTNRMEYFAEATEAYFYKNDFYPFVGSELKQHDPQGYALMQTIWGPLD